jgi:hypothetical protein
MLENARAMPARSPRTTKLYDRTRDETTFDEAERIIIGGPGLYPACFLFARMTASI